MAKQTDDQRTVATFDERTVADAEAARLVGAGIGATVDLHVPESEPGPSEADQADDAPRENLWASLGTAGSETDPEGETSEAVEAGAPDGVGVSGAVPEVTPRWDVRVLLGDLPRACEELGIPVPEPEEPPRRSIPPWATVLIIWLIAIVTLPLLAFWITVNVLD